MRTITIRTVGSDCTVTTVALTRTNRSCTGNASFDDLTTWSPTRKALVLPDGMSLFNNDVALVHGLAAATAATKPKAAPAHQAAMIIEGRSDKGVARPGPFAVNTGTDGDYGANWVMLDGSAYNLGYPKGAAGEGTGDAPTLRFDAEEGYYYSIGGGWITNGPARSRTLASDSWTVSPLAPMAVPDARAVAVGLPATDQAVGVNTAYFSAVWAARGGVDPTTAAFARNLSEWAWGATDPDLCCSDGVAPSFLLNTLSRQGTPKANASDAAHSYGFSRFREANATLNVWLRSYFPAKPLKSDDLSAPYMLVVALLATQAAAKLGVPPPAAPNNFEPWPELGGTPIMAYNG
eukprot:SAG11_NODE_1361_length_5112_cov_2.921404_4_plen_349_part_00